MLGWLPHRPLVDPAVAVLLGNVAAGSHWTFAAPHEAPTVTFPPRP